MVFEELTSSWQRAIQRAEIRGIEPRQYAEQRNGDSHVRRYFVPSGSRDGLRHSVRVAVSAAGVDVACTCEGSMRGHICMRNPSTHRWRSRR
jgi:hypothetical protein